MQPVVVELAVWQLVGAVERDMYVCYGDSLDYERSSPRRRRAGHGGCRDGNSWCPPLPNNGEHSLQMPVRQPVVYALIIV